MENSADSQRVMCDPPALGIFVASLPSCQIPSHISE